MVKSLLIAIGFTMACSLVLWLVLQSERPASNEKTNWNGSDQLESRSVVSIVPNVGNASHHQLLLLHRQKRYLVFPEGSSLQLVFDLIIPIVDYTNFAILGITCAIAWELPSKPPSELLENLRTRLNDGTLGTVRRNDSVQPATEYGQFIGTTTANWQAMHALPTAESASTYAANVQSSSSSGGPYYTNLQSNVGASVYANSPNGQQHAGGSLTNWHARESIPKWRQWASSSPATAYPYPKRAGAGRWSDNWWQRNRARVQNNWREKQRQWSIYEQPTSSYTQQGRRVLQKPPKHHIYPVFGKRRRRRRSLTELPETSDDSIEKVHLVQHLSSRELLFAKIERLYKSQQLNGTACIQRALCESAQRQRRTQLAEAEPQSFIMELLSAIFQLPHTHEANGLLLEGISLHYLDAHRQQGNCREFYGDCNQKFWFE